MPQKGVLLFPGVTASHSGCTCGPTQVPALEHVANRPIAHHVLDTMCAAGVDEVIVAGAADVLIDVQACLRRYDRARPTIDYAMSGKCTDMTAALQAAAPLVGAAPCIVHVGDGLLDAPLAPYVDALQTQGLDLILVCRDPSGWSGSNFAAPRNGSSLATRGIDCEAGLGVFGPGAFRDACNVGPDAEPSGLDRLAQHLSGEGRQVEVRLVEGWRQYRGSPQDLLEINRLALDLLAPSAPHRAGFDNRIEGRVQIDPTAKVSASVIVGPVVVGAGAEVSNAYIGPYTSIGAEARIEGAEIERSIILPGASIMHVGARLISSLVGRGAHVFRDFSLPRAMRLCVGDGDEVVLC
jgi:glucose-1-phosphate thymidylyltransferase